MELVLIFFSILIALALFQLITLWISFYDANYIPCHAVVNSVFIAAAVYHMCLAGLFVV